MRVLTRLVAGAVMAATATALAIAPAIADPVNSHGRAVTPRESDIVGVGSDTIEYLLDQLSLDYNATHHRNSQLYSWDALNPRTGLIDNIRTKAGCAATPRPNGSSAGILALTANAKTRDRRFNCIDFTRSSRGRKSTDPAKGPGGIEFVALAKDAVTFATNSATNAPANLSARQLGQIYSCTVTNWRQVGGRNGRISAQLPQTGSGTRAFFLTAIGVVTPGACVNSTAEENEGVNRVLAGRNTIFPYSVGKYLAETYHSGRCGTRPARVKNQFGCDNHGAMVLHSIGGSRPTTGRGAAQTINARFNPLFVRVVYDVVRYSATTADHIPSYLEQIFASAHARHTGWLCSSRIAQRDEANYGFLLFPFCGTPS